MSRGISVAHQEGVTTNWRSRFLSTAGISIVEMLVVAGIIAVLSTVALPNFRAAIIGSRADRATTITLNAMRVARDRSIAERRNFQVVFTLPNKIDVVRQEIPTGATTVSTTYLEDGQKFMVTSGLPDTPDAFGNASAIAFASTPMAFTSEGTVVDTTGDPLNGTVFIGVPGQLTGARAITVLGATAGLRTWRWDGRRWVD